MGAPAPWTRAQASEDGAGDGERRAGGGGERLRRRPATRRGRRLSDGSPGFRSAAVAALGRRRVRGASGGDDRGDPEPDHRGHRPAHHRGRAGRREPHAVGDHVLRAGRHRHHAVVRQDGRPHRPQRAVHRRAGPVRGGLGRVRAGPVDGRARDRPRRAGLGRRRAHGALAGHRGRRGAAAPPRALPQHHGRGLRRAHAGRPVAGRILRRRGGLALGVLVRRAARAGRHRHRRRLPAETAPPRRGRRSTSAAP